MFLNDESCLVRPTLINMNPVEFKYHPFIISLNKRTESCNGLSPKTCDIKETKDINVKLCDTITNNNEAKPMTDHI